MSGFVSLSMLLMFILLPLQRAPKSPQVLIRWLIVGTVIYYLLAVFIIQRLPS